MNAPDRLMLADIQSQPDSRNIRIDSVGIKGVRYPVTLLSNGTTTPTVATFAMTVSLPPAVKGTHMSRFIELLETHTDAFSSKSFMAMTSAMLKKLEAESGTIEMRFLYFVRKTAPVSGVQSLLDLEVSWRASVSADGQSTFRMQVIVPATSLCPCSKEISAYGAHNQRSHITMNVELAGDLPVEALVRMAEEEASCELWGLLKRPDEKFVTERAYENPKFVEDLVRDIAMRLNADDRIVAYVLEAENFESIHNHSAYAVIERDKRTVR